jgi:hypothetical protein
MTEKDISEFLYVEWLEPADHEELCRAVGVRYHPRPRETSNA